MLTHSQTILRYMLNKTNVVVDIKMNTETEFEIKVAEHKELILCSILMLIFC